MAFEKTWTLEEELFLAENCCDMSPEDIAKHLGKTKQAVIMKKFYLTHKDYDKYKNDPLYQPPRMTKAEKIYRLECLAKEMRVKLKKGE